MRHSPTPGLHEIRDVGSFSRPQLRQIQPRRQSKSATAMSIARCCLSTYQTCHLPTSLLTEILENTELSYSTGLMNTSPATEYPLRQALSKSHRSCQQPRPSAPANHLRQGSARTSLTRTSRGYHEDRRTSWLLWPRQDEHETAFVQ